MRKNKRTKADRETWGDVPTLPPGFVYVEDRYESPYRLEG